MYKKHKIFAIVPARGGSKGIPLKNLSKIGNKTLVEHTLMHAFKSKFLDRIILSTDNSSIIANANIYKKKGLEILKRPGRLAQDSTPMIDVIKDVLRKVNGEPDFVMILQPTSPFRDPHTIDRSIASIIRAEKQSFVALCKVKHSPYKMFRIENNRLKPLMVHNNLNVNRQQLPETYRQSGSLYISSVKLIISKNLIIDDNPEFFIVDELQGLDIDDYLDLEMARKLYRSKV